MTVPHKHRFVALLIAIAISLSFSHMRFGIGVFTLSITSLLSVLFISLYFFSKRHSLKNIVTPHTLSILISLLLINIFIAAFFRSSVHAWGIAIEWFLLPILLASILYSAITTNFIGYRYLIRSLMIILVLTVVSSLIFYIMGDVTFDQRLFGLWPSPNHLALFITPLLIALLPHCVAPGRWRLARFILLIGAVSTVFLTQSLIASTLLMGALLFFGASFLKNKPLHYAYGLITILIITTFAGITVFVPRIQQLFQDIDRSSLASRMTIIDVSTLILQKEPLLPQGISFQENYLEQQEFYVPYLEWSVPSPHNIYLMTWYVGGWSMLLISLLLISFLLCHGSVTSRRNRHSDTYAGYIALCVIMLHGTVDTSYFRIDLAYLFCLITVIILLPSTIAVRQNDTTKKPH